MVGGEIKVLLTLDNGQFTIQTQKAGQTISELKRSLDQTAQSSQALEKHFTGLGQKFHDVVRTASLMRFAIQDVHDIFLSLPTAVLKSSGEMERMTLLMKGMSKETSDAAKQLDAIKNTKFVFDMAQKNPFDVKTLTDSFVKLKSAGIDPTNGSLQALSDSVAKFGGTSETMHRASIAIQQMAGKGVISMEELRQQLGEAVPNAINLMAQGSGMSMQKFAAAVKEGTVGATVSLQNMFTVMRYENGGAAAAMMDSWSGMLSLLATKFELFKVDIGKGGFFKEAKEQLQALIDLFGSNEAKKFANQLGEDLATIVRGLRVVVEFTIKWWDTIKLAGEAYALYFAANKVIGFTEAFRKSIMDRVGLYTSEIAAQEAAKANKLKLITEEIAAEEAAFIKKQTNLARQVEAENAAAAKAANAEVAKMEKQRIALAQELADRVQHYQQLNTLQQQFLMQQMAAELEAEAQLRRKKAGSAAAAAVANAEAMRIANNAAVLSGTVASTKAEIDALKAKEAALLASIAATRNHTIANAADAAAGALAAEHFKKTAILLDQKAAASTAAALSVGMLGRAMTGLKLVFDAFGGWVGLAIGVLVTLGEKLWSYMNRWEEFRKVVERTERGISSKEDLEKATARAAELEEQIKKKQGVLDDMNKAVDDRFLKNRALAAGYQTVPEYKEGLAKQIAADKAELDKITKTKLEQVRLAEEEVSSRSVELFRREFDRANAEKLKTFREGTTASVAAEEKAVKAARDAAIERGAKLTGPAEDAVRAPYIAQRNALIKQSNQAVLDFALVKAAELDAQIKIETDAVKRRNLEAQKVFIDEQVKQARAQNEQAKTLGTVDIRGKEQNDKPIDPLLRYVTTLSDNLDKAKLKLEASIEGVRDLAKLRNEAAVQVLGDMAEGRFDKSLGKNEDGTTKYKYVGDKSGRQTVVAEFLKQLRSGSTDVDAFVNSLTTLDEAEKKLIISAINYAAELPAVKEQQRALTDAGRQEAKTLEDLSAARERYASGGLAKESEGMLTLQKHYAELAKSVSKAGTEFDEFQRKRAAAFANQAQTDVFNFGSEQAKALRDATLAQVKATQTVSEAKEYEHQQNLKRIREQADALEASLFRQMAAEKQTDEEKKALAESYNTLQKSTGDAVAAENARHNVAMMTQLQELRKTWADSVQGMNQLSANWANTFMDSLVNVISGTKVNWKAMVASMAKDLLSVVMKKTFGDIVTSTFSSISGGITSALGLGGATGAAGGAAGMAAQTASIQTAMAAMTTSVTTAQGEMVLATTTSTGEQTLGIAEMVLTTSAAMSEMVIVVSTAMAEMAAASAAGAAFANGGIMTSAGPVSLNAYANGGVANRPQLALFGEGSTPEAYVPLPDGRTIPVTMTGMNTTNNNQGGVYISINVANGSDNTSSEGDDAETWKRVAQRVKGVVLEELVTQQRPGGVLSR